MIVVRSPLRLSLGGGGTDLPSYYQAWWLFDCGGDRSICLCGFHKTMMDHGY